MRSDEAMKGRGILIVLAVIMLSLLAFGVRAWRLEAKGIWYDESLSLYRARLSLPEILSNRISFPGAITTDVHPPLYFLLEAAFIRLAGESDYSLRFLSVAWAALLVPLLYVTGTRFWNRRVGLIAALFGALSPFYLWYAQEMRMYTMVTALALFALYAFDRGIELGQGRWIAGSALAVVALAYTHYLALLFLPVLGVRTLLAVRLRPTRRLAILVVLACVVVASLPVALYALSRLAAGPEIERRFIPLPRILADALHVFDVGLTLSQAQAWPIDLLFLAVFLVGALWPDPRRRWLLLWAYVLIPIFGIYCASLIKPVYMGSRYLMLVSPGCYLGVARGFERGSRRLWPVALVVGLVLVASVGLSVRNYFFEPHYQTKEDYRSVARLLAERERPGDVIVINAPENATAFLHYYAGRLPLIRLPRVAMNGNPDQVASDQDVANVASRFDRVWLVRCDSRWSDPQGYIEAWLKKETFLAEETVYPSYGSTVALQLYLTREPILQVVPPHQHTLRVDFKSLRLEGYDLPLHPVAGGQRAWVTFYWRVLQPGIDVKASLRLVDARGQQWGQTDEVPYLQFPPKYWPADAIVRHEASLLVPLGVPPGWYSLELRLYDPESGRPFEPARGAQPGALTLGALRIDATWARQVSLRGLDGDHYTLLGGGGAHFAETMSLLAHRVSAQRVRPGEWLHLDLYWQVEEPSERDLTLSVDLIDRSGQVIGQYTATPVSPDYAPASWRPAELLWGQHDLLFPPGVPPGTYHLRLRVSDPSGRMLPIRDRWRFWTWGEEAMSLGSIEVVDVPRVFTRPAMEHALETQSTAGVDLLGFDGAPDRIKPGEPLDITVYWRAAAVPDRDYKASLQLLAADGSTILAQEDGIPVNWTRPTTSWALNEILNDPYHLVVPKDAAPQVATLILALYDEDTAQRVQWLDKGQAQDHVVLAKIEIVR